MHRPVQKSTINTNVKILAFVNNAITETMKLTPSNCKLGFENLDFVDLK